MDRKGTLVLRFNKVRQPTPWATWRTGPGPEAYVIKQRGGLVSFAVYGPRSSEPPHFREKVGGCNSLQQAKAMAQAHASKKEKSNGWWR